MAASLDAFARALERDAGEPGLLSDEGTEAFALGGKAPDLIARPSNAGGVARVLARAEEAGLAVFPWGGGTSRGAGYPPERYDVALSTERLNRTVEFLKDDLTAVVEAGVTVAALNALTAPEGQTAGLDPPLPARATVGGTFAAEKSGPMRLRYGRARDRLMRMRVALPSGAEHTYGALVVKNVTGYDMNRLLAGSWGTLGVATELAVRLYKAPERTGACAAGFPVAEGAFAAARMLMATPLTPLWAEVVDEGWIAGAAEAHPGLELPGRWCLVAGFGDFEEGLAEQLGRFDDLIARRGGGEVVRLEEEAARRAGAALADPPGGAFADPEAIALRASGRLDQLPRFAQAAREAAEWAGCREAVAAHAGSGILRCRLAPEGSPEGRAWPEGRVWEVFSSLCRAGADPSAGRGVTAWVEGGPAAFRERVPVWGEDAMPPAVRSLMKKIKNEYDPRRTLSPGRFVGRL